MRKTFKPYVGKLSSKLSQKKKVGKAKKPQWPHKTTTVIATKRKNGTWMA